MARTVDHISGGRLIWGIGSGWFEKNYEAYGYELGTPGGRLDALDQDLPVITSRLPRLNPPPTRHIPVLIGGGGERKTLRIVAEHADIWHGFGDAATVGHKHQVLDQWCVKAGRDPRDIERSSGVSPSDPSGSAESLYAVGTRLFTYGVTGPSYDLSPLRDLIAWRDERNAG